LAYLYGESLSAFFSTNPETQHDDQAAPKDNALFFFRPMPCAAVAALRRLAAGMRGEAA
jgi:hypothetical protein